VTPLLASQIWKATNALPSAHLVTLISSESLVTPEDALRRFQGRAFTQGFAIVTESSRKGQSYLRLYPPQGRDPEQPQDRNTENDLGLP
jgi:hypothetical protein